MNQDNKKKYILISIAALIAAGILYCGAALAFHLWPFNAQTKLESPSSTSAVKINMQKPTINSTTKVLSTNTVIDTKEQGKCTLTLSNKTNKYVLQNSTEGIEGRTGCLDWNIGIESIPAGEYDVTIKFTGKTQTAVSSQKVTIK